jgi:hypothetical protein
MIAIYEAIGAKKAKTHITYRYFMEESHSFMRYKDEMAEKHKLMQE